MLKPKTVVLNYIDDKNTWVQLILIEISVKPESGNVEQHGIVFIIIMLEAFLKFSLEWKFLILKIEIISLSTINNENTCGDVESERKSSMQALKVIINLKCNIN